MAVSSKRASRTSIGLRLIVEHAGMDHLIFKHAIATIRTPRSVPNYFSSHHP